MPKGYHGDSTWNESRERVNSVLSRLEENENDFERRINSINLRLAILETKALVYGSIGGLVVTIVLHFLLK